MAAGQEKLNPEWFMILSDQGFMPLYETKQQMELFGTKIMPEFMGEEGALDDNARVAV